MKWRIVATLIGPIALAMGIASAWGGPDGRVLPAQAVASEAVESGTRDIETSEIASSILGRPVKATSSTWYTLPYDCYPGEFRYSGGGSFYVDMSDFWQCFYWNHYGVPGSWYWPVMDTLSPWYGQSEPPKPANNVLWGWEIKDSSNNSLVACGGFGPTGTSCYPDNYFYVDNYQCSGNEKLLLWAFEPGSYHNLTMWVELEGHVPSSGCDYFPDCDYFLWAVPGDIYHEDNDDYYQCWLGN